MLGKSPPRRIYRPLVSTEYMEKQIAIEIAKEHVDQMNQESLMIDIIRWKVSAPVEFPDCWYFDNEFENLTDDDVNIAGAPGYIITKSDGNVKEIGWQEYQTIRRENGIN